MMGKPFNLMTIDTRTICAGCPVRETEKRLEHYREAAEILSILCFHYDDNRRRGMTRILRDRAGVALDAIRERQKKKEADDV